HALGAPEERVERHDARPPLPKPLLHRDHEGAPDPPATVTGEDAQGIDLTPNIPEIGHRLEPSRLERWVQFRLDLADDASVLEGDEAVPALADRREIGVDPIGHAVGVGDLEPRR